MLSYTETLAALERIGAREIKLRRGATPHIRCRMTSAQALDAFIAGLSPIRTTTTTNGDRYFVAFASDND